MCKQNYINRYKAFITCTVLQGFVLFCFFPLSSATKIFVNGCWVGIHKDPEQLMNTLRKLRRQMDIIVSEVQLQDFGDLWRWGRAVYWDCFEDSKQHCLHTSFFFFFLVHLLRGISWKNAYWKDLKIYLLKCFFFVWVLMFVLFCWQHMESLWIWELCYPILYSVVLIAGWDFALLCRSQWLGIFVSGKSASILMQAEFADLF